MDVAILSSELAGDPASLGYSGKTSQQIEALLLAPTRTVVRAINTRQLLEWSGQQSRYTKIEGAATSSASTELCAIAKVALKLLDRQDAELDLSRDAHLAMLDALVGGGVLTVSDRSSLVSLATVQVSRADELGIPDVRYWDIARSLAQ